MKSEEGHFHVGKSVNVCISRQQEGFGGFSGVCRCPAAYMGTQKSQRIPATLSASHHTAARFRAQRQRCRRARPGPSCRQDSGTGTSPPYFPKYPASLNLVPPVWHSHQTDGHRRQLRYEGSSSMLKTLPFPPASRQGRV